MATGRWDRVEQTYDLWGLGDEAPAWTELEAAIRQEGGDVVIDLADFDGGTIRFADATLADLGLTPDRFTGLDIEIPTPRTTAEATEEGSEGNDTLTGSSGDDNIHGKGGADALLGGAGDDYVDGGAGSDKLWGQEGNDGIRGGGGSDLVYGQDGDDTIAGGGGRDILLGSGGNDQIRGDEGNDGIRAEAGQDVVRGKAGDDFLSGGSGDDTLLGGTGNDYLHGGDGNDILWGQEGQDVLAGAAGDDTLYSGSDEQETFFGGRGADQFAIYSGGPKWIMDYDPTSDRLDIGMHLGGVERNATQLGRPAVAVPAIRGGHRHDPHRHRPRGTEPRSHLPAFDLMHAVRGDVGVAGAVALLAVTAQAHGGLGVVEMALWGCLLVGQGGKGGTGSPGGEKGGPGPTRSSRSSPPRWAGSVRRRRP